MLRICFAVAGVALAAADASAGIGYVHCNSGPVKRKTYDLVVPKLKLYTYGTAAHPKTGANFVYQDIGDSVFIIVDGQFRPGPGGAWTVVGGNNQGGRAEVTVHLRGQQEGQDCVGGGDFIAHRVGR